MGRHVFFYRQTLPSCILLLLILSGSAYADCSCAVGANGVNVIGFEHVAVRCPVEPPSDKHLYTYLVNPIRCEGGVIRKYSTYGDVMASPGQLIAFYQSRGYRVLRNPSGTHFIMVQRGKYPFSGVVAGVNMSVAAPGVYYTTPETAMNQYCTVCPVADQNGNGIPDCLEQAEILVPRNLAPACPISGG